MTAAVNCFVLLRSAVTPSSSSLIAGAYSLAKQMIIASSSGVVDFVDYLERIELHSLPVDTAKHIVTFIISNRMLFYNQNLHRVYIPYLDRLFGDEEQKTGDVISPEQLLLAKLCLISLAKCIDNFLLSNAQISNEEIAELRAKQEGYGLELQRRTREMSHKFTKAAVDSSKSSAMQGSYIRSSIGGPSLQPRLGVDEVKLIHDCISARSYVGRAGSSFSGTAISNNDFSAAPVLSKKRKLEQGSCDSNNTIPSRAKAVARCGAEFKLPELISACTAARKRLLGSDSRNACAEVAFTLLPQIARLGDALATATVLAALELWRSDVFSDELFLALVETFYHTSAAARSGGGAGERVMAALLLQRVRRLTAKASRSTLRALETAVKGTSDLPLLFYTLALSVKGGGECGYQYEVHQRLARQVVSNEQYNLMVVQLVGRGSARESETIYSLGHDRDTLHEMCLVDNCLSNAPTGPCDNVYGAFKAMAQQDAEVTSIIYSHNIIKSEGLKNSLKFLNSLVVTSNKNNVLSIDTVRQMLKSLYDSLIESSDCASSNWMSDPSLSAMLNYLVCHHSGSFAARDIFVCREILSRCLNHNTNNMIAKNAMNLLDKL